jgi:hypothetical protein
MYIRNTEKNKFSDQHQDVAASVPTSTQVFLDMFQYFREHQQGTCTTGILRKANSQSKTSQHLHKVSQTCSNFLVNMYNIKVLRIDSQISIKNTKMLHHESQHLHTT